MTVEYDVNIQEKEIISVDFSETDIINVELNVIDIYPLRRELGDLEDVVVTNPQNDEVLTYEDGNWVNKPPEEIEVTPSIYNEAPSQLTVKRYRTAFAFITGTLRVFLNGIKEKYIVIHSDREFSFPIDTVAEDTIEVSYEKK